MAHMTAAREAIHMAAKTGGDKIGDGADELTGMPGVHRNWSSSGLHRDQ
jgi:hypothetical protein